MLLKGLKNASKAASTLGIFLSPFIAKPPAITAADPFSTVSNDKSGF